MPLVWEAIDEDDQKTIAALVAAYDVQEGARLEGETDEDFALRCVEAFCDDHVVKHEQAAEEAALIKAREAAAKRREKRQERRREARGYVLPEPDEGDDGQETEREPAEAVAELPQ